MDFIELHGNRVYMGARPLFFYPEYELQAELEQRYVPALLSEGVRTVAVLMPMEEIQRHYGRDLLDLYRGYGLEVLWYPIEDFQAPKDMDSFHGFIGGYRTDRLGFRSLADLQRRECGECGSAGAGGTAGDDRDQRTNVFSAGVPGVFGRFEQPLNVGQDDSRGIFVFVSLYNVRRDADY